MYPFNFHYGVLVRPTYIVYATDYSSFDGGHKTLVEGTTIMSSGFNIDKAIDRKGYQRVDVDDHQPIHEYPDQTLACGYMMWFC